MRKTLSLFILFLFLLQVSCSYAEDIVSPPIVIYGDSRTGHDAHRKIVDAIMKAKPIAVFHTGDLVQYGFNPEQWTTFGEITSELMATAAFYPALGNHECDAQLYFDYFDLPNNERWYSVDIENIHFIVLDSNTDISEDSEQYQWLKADLQKVSDRTKFVIALFHHPPFGTGKKVKGEEELREVLVPLFEQNGVDIVFNGHVHAYERSFCNDIYYIITGGGGAPLHNQVRSSPYSQKFIKTHHFCTLTVQDNRLTVDVFDIDSNLIDQLIIEQKRSGFIENRVHEIEKM